MSSFYRLTWFIFIATIFHLLLWNGMYWYINFLPPTNYKKPIDIEVIDQNQLQKKMESFVKDTKIPKELEVPDSDPKKIFLSQEKQRVKEEMKAAESGVTENRADKIKVENETVQKEFNEKINTFKKNPNLFAPQFDPNPSQKKKNDFNAGSSTISTHLPEDIKVGSMTSLNTDRHLFYSFYSRFEDKVYYPWLTKIRPIIHNMEIHTFLAKDWITDVEFILDKNGYFQKAIVHDGSGSKDIDKAIVSTVKEEAPYLNPPPEMVQIDGRIHLRFKVMVSGR